MKGRLPDFVADWSGNFILLVWGRPTFDQIKNAAATCFHWNDKSYDVVVFKSSSSGVQNMLYGGQPVLLYDVSGVDLEELQLSRQGREIWAINLPFWNHAFRTLERDDDRQLLTKITNIQHVNPIELLSSLCYGCFNNTATTTDFGCHPMCASCVDCFHHSHKREYRVRDFFFHFEDDQ